MSRTTWTRRGALAALGALSVTAILWSPGAAERSWKELGSVAELRERFNQDRGSIRLVLLLSPT